MDENLKNAIKQKLKGQSKRILKICIIIFAVIVILAASLYNVKLDDGTYKEGDWANTQYAASQYTRNTSISDDGTITTDMTAKELWDKLIKENSRVSLYLNGPEELQRLMNAQLVTQYLDTRENPDEEIDWDAITDINSNEVQGIIKLKRAKDDGNTITMTYVDPETFQSYIDAYNNSGSESDRERALSHFTLEKSTVSSTTTGGELQEIDGVTMSELTSSGKVTFYNGDGSAIEGGSNDRFGQPLADGKVAARGLANDHSVIYIETQESGEGSYANGKFFYICDTGGGLASNQIDVYANVGQTELNAAPYGTYNNAKMYLVEENVTWEEYQSKYYNKTVGNSNTGTENTDTQTDNDGEVEEGQNDETTSSDSNTNSNSSTDSMDGMIFIGDSFTDGLEQSNLISEASFYAEVGVAPQYWLDHFEELPSDSDDVKGVCVLLGVNNPDQVDQMKQLITKLTERYPGKNIYIQRVFPVGTNYTYGNKDELNAKIDNFNSEIEAYCNTLDDVNFIDTTTGYVDENGVINDSLLGSDGLHLNNYEKWAQNIKDKIGGNNSTDNTKNNVQEDSAASAYYAKVATWNEVTTTVESNDPDVESYSTTTYNMTATKINYYDFVSGYTMPFDYLWDLLVMTEHQGFVLDLADLVYNSEIEITVHDNLSINTNVNTYTYTENEKIVSSGVRISGVENGSVVRTASPGGSTEQVNSTDRTVVRTIITKTNTLDIALTKANVWIVNYTQEFTYEVPETVVTQGGAGALEDIPYTSEPDHTTNTDDIGYGESQRQSYQSQWSQTNPGIVATLDAVQCDYYYSTTNRNESITNTLESKKYVSSPPNIVEKTDKYQSSSTDTEETTDEDEDETKPNFVTVLLAEGNRQAKHYILDAPDWLFMMLERNKSTADMVDLTKYLLYKATGTSYGVTEFDFSIFDPANFVSNSGGANGTSGITGVPGQIYDFLLQKGVPPVGAAAILGNIQGESSFDSTVVNEIGCSGLCQWGGGRLENLKNYANSKGTDWTDINTQLEFLWQELNGSYTDVKDVIMSATQESDLEYATWYFGRYYEIYFIGTWPSSKNQTAKRYEYASEWYKQYQQNSTSLSGGNSQAVEIAKSKIGSPYVYGAAGPDTFDCSGLLYWVYQQMGISIPRATEGYRPYLSTSNEISWSQAQPGDLLIIFPEERKDGYNDGHAAMYLGNDSYIHAPSSGKTVTIVDSGAQGRFPHVFRFN